MARLGSLLLTGAIALSACSVGSSELVAPEPVSSVPDRTEATPPVPTPEPTPIPEVLALAEPVDTDLRLAVVSIPPTDPVLASVVEPTHMVVIDLLYDGLTRWEAADATWAPDLATTFTSSADGLTWTAELSPGRTFSDGTPISPKRVADSIRRLVDAPGTLAGARADMIESIDVVSSSVVFRLSRPFADLPALLSSPLFGIVPDAAPDGLTASGPLVLTEGARLVPWAAPATASDDLPSVALVPFADEDAAVQAHSDGSVDLVYLSASSSVAADLTRPSLVEAHFAFNVKARSLTDADLRLALTASVERSSVVEAGFGSGAVAVVGLQASVVPCDSPCGGSEATVTVDEPLEVAYVADDAGREVRLAESFAAELRDAGVDAEAVPYPLEGFVDLIASGRHQIVRTGWVGMYPSADSQLAPYLTASTDNITGYSNAVVDEAIAGARLGRAEDGYTIAAAAVGADAPVIPVARLLLRALVADNVDGLELRPDGSFDIGAVLVDHTG